MKAAAKAFKRGRDFAAVIRQKRQGRQNAATMTRDDVAAVMPLGNTLHDLPFTTPGLSFSASVNSHRGLKVY
jgi:hypothetical protein